MVRTGWAKRWVVTGRTRSAGRGMDPAIANEPDSARNLGASSSLRSGRVAVDDDTAGGDTLIGRTSTFPVSERQPGHFAVGSCVVGLDLPSQIIDRLLLGFGPPHEWRSRIVSWMMFRE